MANYLTQQDVNDYGEDLISVSQRAALEVVAPHLQNLADQNENLRQHLAVQARQALDARVAAAVPNFREIDAMPEWHQWLTEQDQLSGRQRQQLLNEAIAANNTGRVVSFFRQFMQGGGQSASYPSGRGSSGKPTYTRALIQQLYERHRKGGYAGREAEWARQEQDIIAAAAEGRVLGPAYVSK